MQGRDTTAESVSYDPGTENARNQAGEIVPVPESRIESVEEATVSELMEQFAENNKPVVGGTAIG